MEEDTLLGALWLTLLDCVWVSVVWRVNVMQIAKQELAGTRRPC
jgi:hypothetical protein